MIVVAGTTLHSSSSGISIWKWSASGIFLLHSLYEWLDFDDTEYDIV
jgi:hypothetical protein